MLGILWRLLLFRPDVVVLTGKQEYWWLLSPLRLTGTRFVASLHSVIWTPFHRLKRHYKALIFLNQHLILRHLAAVAATSKRISEQFAELTRGAHIPLFNHLPTWEPEQFDGVTPADQLSSEPFSIMFMGRIERDKGVYDLLGIAALLQRERPGEFEFHVCGDGTELPQVLKLVAEEGLGDVVRLHGYCPPDRMKEVMSGCHAAIVPTRTDCPAGFEMTCAEAILCGRPLITSAVAPAIDYLRPATIEVPPEDVAGYKEAIAELKDDAGLYRRKHEACAGLRQQFFSYENSWDHAMREAFAAALPAAMRRPLVTPR
jgi:glycosyltransferase involved in cell wall biosynthesis